MEIIELRDEFIKLGQALKAAGLVESGAEAKEVITEGLVKVNNITEIQRGKKLHSGDIVSYNGNEIEIR
ncbi:MAG TPA: RNA-binding S4 domain-containing protein [Lachnospiraceae bacterium]|jgi:ribosome-associated protein|nr:s4 domain protein [Butyrivibrio sp. CAG:318]HJI32579.1 RNA-binding S4 domain-containing protein [Lachnospiraceae bacterium]